MGIGNANNRKIAKEFESLLTSSVETIKSSSLSIAKMCLKLPRQNLSFLFTFQPEISLLVHVSLSLPAMALWIIPDTCQIP